jgi:imidazolonepropionase-like amidohydrolase
VPHLEAVPGLIEITDHADQYLPFDRSATQDDDLPVPPIADMRLWGARAIDPASGRVFEHATIGIVDGVITDIADAGGDAPEGAIDVSGFTALPGIVDAHTHLASDTSRSPGFGPAAPLRGEDPRPRELGYLLLAQTCQALLDAGVTTIRDVGSYHDEAITMRKAVELGLVRGPRIRSCGRIVSATSPGGRMFKSMYDEVDGPWEMRRAVRANLRRGADFVKLMATGARSVEREDPEPAQLTQEEVAALVDEAHRLGLRVAAHAEGLDGARLAIEAGVDTIEHGLSLHRAPELLERMAASEQVLVPTLTTFHDLAERFAHEWVPKLVDQAKRQLEEAYVTLEAARLAGVTMAMGFDSGPPSSHLWELVRMVEGGLTSLEGMRAATVGGAAALGSNELGRLEPGSPADLVVVEGDPLRDIRVLIRPRRIRLVLAGGVAVAGRLLDPPRLDGHTATDDLELAEPSGPLTAGCTCGALAAVHELRVA